jgi:hypothetical protein
MNGYSGTLNGRGTSGIFTRNQHKPYLPAARL